MKPQYQIKDFIPDPNTHKDCWEVYDIKQGGMGWVYIVYDHVTREPFAVKTYKDKWLQTEKTKEDFKKESLIWINLERHENITQARFVLEIQNRIYLFLEYVVGGDLSRYIGKKLLNIRQIILFALQFCYGMEHAVTHGIICHRDIKPGNCLISKDKTLKITDFGLAKALYSDIEKINQMAIESKKYSDLSKTNTGDVGGTPFYMAPEQFEDIKHLDMRSDIYSFGVMLYEIISGKLPFYGNTWGELLNNCKKKEIPDISTKLNKRERPLIDIVYKCMAKHPANRYINFTKLVKEFTQIYKLLYKENPPIPKKKDELSDIDLIDKGASLANLKHYQEAIECYNKILKSDPKFISAWYNKGVSFGELNRHQEAIECYNKALEIDPKNSKIWYNKGTSFAKLNCFQEELECYNEALSINPKYIKAWYNKGTLLLKLNRLQEAIECYDKIHEIDLKDLDAWANKGVALGNLNRYKEAIECFNKALEINSKNSKVWNDKGLTLANLNHHQEAIECYYKALEIAPEYLNAWFNKGVSLGMLNHYQEAIECYNKVLEIDPKYSEAWNNKGISLAILGYLPQAIETLKKAKELGYPNVEQIILQIQNHL